MTEAMRVLQTAPVNTMAVATGLQSSVPASRQGSREHRADSMESRASHHLQPPEHRRSPDNHQPGSTEYRYSHWAGSTEHRGDQRTEPSGHHEDRRAGSREQGSHRRDGSPEHRDFHRTGSMERRGHHRNGSSEHRDYRRKESAERRDYRRSRSRERHSSRDHRRESRDHHDSYRSSRRTGVDLQATRTEAAVDIRQPHTATMKILLGMTPVTGAIGLRNVVTPLFDVGLIVEALHHNTVGHGAHAKPQASWRLPSSSQGYPPSVAANPESPEQSPGTGFPTHLQFGSPSWDCSQLEHRNRRRLCLRWMLFTSSRPHPVSNQITPSEL